MTVAARLCGTFFLICFAALGVTLLAVPFYNLAGPLSADEAQIWSFVTLLCAPLGIFLLWASVEVCAELVYEAKQRKGKELGCL